MDLDEHLRDWATSSRAAAHQISNHFHIPDDAITGVQRGRGVWLIAATIIAVITLAVALIRVGSGTKNAPSTRPAHPPADVSRRVECGTIPFTAHQLTGPTINLAGTQGDVAALRFAISHPDNVLIGVPRGYTGRHWYAIRANPNTTLFMTHLHDMSYVAATAKRRHGHWKILGSGGCIPSHIFADRSLGTITAVAPSPTSDDTLLIASRPVGPCGTSPTAAQFHVKYTATRIAITVTYPLPPAPPAGQVSTCPQLPEPPFSLKLDEPIANRKIYDNGFLRPRLITASPTANAITASPIPKTPVK
jgi:hypothetical protein